MLDLTYSNACKYKEEWGCKVGTDVSNGQGRAQDEL